jgi:hypothetical protein
MLLFVTTIKWLTLISTSDPLPVIRLLLTRNPHPFEHPHGRWLLWDQIQPSQTIPSPKDSQTRRLECGSFSSLLPFFLVCRISSMDFISFPWTELQSPPKRHNASLEPRYRHLLETPFHTFLQKSTRKGEQLRFPPSDGRLNSIEVPCLPRGRGGRQTPPPPN